MLPPNDKGGLNCRCHACQGIHCMIYHPGHDHSIGVSGNILEHDQPLHGQYCMCSKCIYEREDDGA